MNAQTDRTAPPASLQTPQIALAGPLDGSLLATFLDALHAAYDGVGDLVLELTTEGGDADSARRMVSDLRLFRERTGRRTVFLGKGIVYSAGVTVMSAFATSDRWLSRETTLLLHDRSMARTLTLEGPLHASRVRILAVLSDIDAGLTQQRDDFSRLVDGSDLDAETLEARATTGWYMPAEEALSLRLVAGLI